MRPSDPANFLPLSTPVLHVLLALGGECLHGYAIMQAIDQKTGGAARILPGTLYTTLNRMLGEGLVEKAPSPAGPKEDDPRRRYYRVTSLGREVLRAEVARMSVLVKVAVREFRIA